MDNRDKYLTSEALLSNVLLINIVLDLLISVNGTTVDLQLLPCIEILKLEDASLIAVR